MRTSTFTVPAGTSQEISLAGNYLLVKQSAVDLIIEHPEGGEKFEASQGDDFQISNFKSLIITNNDASDQVVKLTVATNKKAGSAKVGGSVNVAGSVTLKNGAMTQGRATVSNGANVPLLAANNNRRYLMIQNNDTSANLRVTFDGNAATAAQGFRVGPGDSLELPTFAPTGAINAIMETVGSGANNIEFVEG